MAQHFHPLEIQDVQRETADCISVSFVIPDELKATFSYQSGQYITLRAEVGDQELRRSYSLCSAPHHNEWRVAIKRVEDGMFSQWAHALLRAGETIDVLPPDGHFRYPPDGDQARHVLLLAAGSGITPILSILTTLLETESTTCVTLVYGNRRVKDIIFKEQIEDLRDRFLTRFQLLHSLSGEIQEAPIANGRLDGAKLNQLFGALIDPKKMDHVYICGPKEMIASCATACEQAGIANELVRRETPAAPTAQNCLWLPMASNVSCWCRIAVIRCLMSCCARASTCLMPARRASVARAARRCSKARSAWMRTTRWSSTKWIAALC
jgi:ring-1,2-phenylacetyl-CoA epoxidase subunit PaaE